MDSDGLVTTLHHLVGDSLRVVGTYSRYDRAFHYVRDDLTGDVDDVHLANVHEGMIFDDLGLEYFEQTFEAGDLDCVSYHLEDAVLFHHVSGDLAGVFVSIDRGTDPPLPDVVEACEEYA